MIGVAGQRLDACVPMNGQGTDADNNIDDIYIQGGGALAAVE